MVRRKLPREFLKSGSGRVGLLFLLVLVATSVYVLATFPLDFGIRFWSNPAVWADNPKNTPPAWTDSASSHKLAPQQSFGTSRPTQILKQTNSTINIYEFGTDFQADEPPTLLSLSISDVTFSGRSPVFGVRFVRPDQSQLLLYSFVVPGASTGESPPLTRYHATPFRVELSGDPGATASVADFARSLGVDVNAVQLARQGTLRVLFGTAVNGTFVVLKGHYTIQVQTQLYDSRDSVGSVALVLGGSAFGLLGTDSLGRDLSVGILFGFPVALFIGVVTALFTTIIGTLTGIVSGYVGGKTDTLIQRVSDVLNNIPLLPILIFLAFIYGQKLWVVVLVLTVFGWPSTTVVIRSMVLQIRSQQFVEAAEVIGASKIQIVIRHIFPQTAPFVLAQMIFTVPAAILAEAALSFLGLGDPSIPTWGQILESGFRSGGVFVGFWWWILPPGLLIVFTAMTFILISLGLEPILNPRLRRVR